MITISLVFDLVFRNSFRRGRELVKTRSTDSIINEEKKKMEIILILLSYT